MNQQFKRPHPFWLLLAGLLGSTTNRAMADVIWMSDGSKHYGIVEDVGESDVQFSAWADETLQPTTTIERNLIARIRTNRDSKRLQNLDSRDPVSYFEYAEELALESSDPTARLLARNLYALAAKLVERPEDAWIVPSSLRALVALESNPERQRRIRLFLALYSDSPTLDNLNLKTKSPEAALPDASRAMLDIVQAIRRNQAQTAIDLLSQPESQVSIEAWKQWISKRELERLARKQKTGREIQRLLSIELEIRTAVSGKNAAESENEPPATWSSQAQQNAESCLVLPTLDSLTEFDLDQTNGTMLGRPRSSVPPRPPRSSVSPRRPRSSVSPRR